MSEIFFLLDVKFYINPWYKQTVFIVLHEILELLKQIKHLFWGHINRAPTRLRFDSNTICNKSI